MTTIEQFEMACEFASRHGFHIRHEYLGGQGGGVCEFGGRKWIFVDLALGTLEQLEELMESLREARLIMSNEGIAEIAELCDTLRAIDHTYGGSRGAA